MLPIVYCLSFNLKCCFLFFFLFQACVPRRKIYYKYNLIGYDSTDSKDIDREILNMLTIRTPYPSTWSVVFFFSLRAWVPRINISYIGWVLGHRFKLQIQKIFNCYLFAWFTRTNRNRKKQTKGMTVDYMCATSIEKSKIWSQ